MTGTTTGRGKSEERKSFEQTKEFIYASSGNENVNEREAAEEDVEPSTTWGRTVSEDAESVYLTDSSDAEPTSDEAELADGNRRAQETEHAPRRSQRAPKPVYFDD
ncbi:hypothetical protein CBL_10608 [Carabus blaptoides fortunei]